MKTNQADIVAVDVAKQQLEVLIASESFSVANTKRGHATLLKRVQTLPEPWVFCEASGGYERDLIALMHRAHVTVTRINPMRLRAFARSEGIQAKNDPTDTRMIARFASEKNLAPTPPPPHPKLTALMDRRRHLSEQLSREKTRLQNSPACIHASIRRMIGILQSELLKLHKLIDQQVQTKPAYHDAAQQMQTIKGVGEVTAWSILAYLPEITQLSRSRITALAGLAPFDRDSGSSHAPRHICAGRHKVREVLYMAAVCAATHNPHIRTYVDAAIKRGKSYRWAMTAAMRKILLHIHATLKKQQLCLVS